MSTPPTSPRPARHILAVGAHPDDIEIGCGGTLLAHRRAGDSVTMLVLTGGEYGPSAHHASSVREAEQEAAAVRLGARLFWGGLADCGVGEDLRTVTVIEDVIEAVGADTVYVHAPDDSHQDHRAAAAATLGAARHVARVLHYQGPSTLTFAPTVFVDIADHVADKRDAVACHRSQVDLSGMVDLDMVEAGARYWGATARVRYAEAFVASRVLLDIAGVGPVAPRARRHRSAAPERTADGQAPTAPDAPGREKR